MWADTRKSCHKWQTWLMYGQIMSRGRLNPTFAQENHPSEILILEESTRYGCWTSPGQLGKVFIKAWGGTNCHRPGRKILTSISEWLRERKREKDHPGSPLCQRMSCKTSSPDLSCFWYLLHADEIREQDKAPCKSKLYPQLLSWVEVQVQSPSLSRDMA